MFYRLIFLFTAVVAGGFGIGKRNLWGAGGALLLAMLSFRGWRPPAPSPVTRTASWPNALWLLGGLAVGASLLASVISLRDSLHPAAPALWIAALVLIVAATLSQDRSLLAPRRWARQLRERPVALELGLVIGLTLIALALRAPDLYQYSPLMHADEAESGLLGLRILEGPEPVPPFVTGWYDLPTLYHYLQAASMALFGHTEAGLRMLSALFGAACIPTLYAVGRLGWGRLAGVTAAWLMTVSHLHIQFSRVAAGYIDPAFFAVLLVLLLLMAHRLARRPTAKVYAGGTALPTVAARRTPLVLWVAVGFILGLSLYLYYAARLIPIVAAPLILFLWITRRANFRQMVVMVAAALVVFAPLGLFYAAHPQTLLSRQSEVSIFNPGNVRHTLGPDAALPRDFGRLARHQVTRTIGFFIERGDESDKYWNQVPAFDTITKVLFWLGLAAALSRLRRFGEFTLLVWFGLGLVLGGFLTINPPTSQRLMVMLPTVYLFGGLFVARAWEMLQGVIRVQLRPVGLLVWSAAAGLLFLINYQFYFVQYGRNATGLAPIMVARELAKEPDQYQAFFMGRPVMYADYGTIRFVARHAQVSELDDINALPPPDSHSKGTLVIALPHRLGELQAITGRYPGGVLSEHQDPAGRPIFYSYRLAPRA